MREPIKPEDIREGDLIRWEDGETAHEFRRGKRGTIARHGQHYLLDRPKPAVDLPTEPTLGWAAFTFHFESEHGFGLPETQLGIWERKTYDNGNDTLRLVSSGHNVSPADGVTAFTPAVAVPAEALETLRRTMPFCLPEDVQTFLEAVDTANEANR